MDLHSKTAARVICHLAGLGGSILTYERAHEVLVYDLATGALNWRIGRPGAPKGALAAMRERITASCRPRSMISSITTFTGRR